MYVLILTLALFKGGVAIEWVPGFTSEASCVAAGNEWLKKVHSGGSVEVRTAVCAKA